MSNKFKNVDINSHTCYFFDDIINIKDFDPNKVKIDKKNHKKLFYTILNIFYTGQVTIKDSKYLKINIVYPVYFIITKVNGYFEGINKNKYLMLIATN